MKRFARMLMLAVFGFFLALLAFIAFFVAGSLSSSFLVGALAALIVLGFFIGWHWVPRGRTWRFVGAALVGVAAVTAYAIWLNQPTPIRADRAAFVGTWVAGSAFRIDIHQTGTVQIRQHREIGEPAWEKLGIHVAMPLIETANVRFDRDHMLVWPPMYGYGRDYTIDKAPFAEDGRQKMMLNGIELIRK